MSNMQPNYDEVICPACCHQFRAIPVNVQAEVEALRKLLFEADRLAGHDPSWDEWREKVAEAARPGVE